MPGDNSERLGAAVMSLIAACVWGYAVLNI